MKTTEMKGNLGGFKLHRGQTKPGQCPDCAVFHPPDQPHNPQSLYYQYSFMEENGRWPTWADALAHCSEEMKAAWKEELAHRGIIVPPQS